ncbi:hypothetical protein U5801_00950 [Lamprobacter modestohalophilus]|uniref:hypothetical protein n=1 Tax=Lamprobacter modestohalophilus TaxID=1064514 RepID=UPI002ADEAE14|nr:hypothetical protein [Lamprobacter modestohalophilus]MEA1048391.1 hypothetical protein [Lamprobacter modestohalophilus]
MAFIKHPPDRVIIPIRLTERAEYLLKDLLINNEIVGGAVESQIADFLLHSDYFQPYEDGDDNPTKTSPDEIELAITCRFPTISK